MTVSSRSVIFVGTFWLMCWYVLDFNYNPLYFFHIYRRPFDKWLKINYLFYFKHVVIVKMEVFKVFGLNSSKKLLFYEYLHFFTSGKIYQNSKLLKPIQKKLHPILFWQSKMKKRQKIRLKHDRITHFKKGVKNCFSVFLIISKEEFPH